jgi:hypothetical protein
MSFTNAETKIGKTVYSAIVILFAVGFPLFLLIGADISEIEINIITVFITLFYFVVVIGFVALIFNVKSVRIKATKLDNNTRGKLKKFYLFIMILVVINIVYLSFKLLVELWK